MKNLPWKGGGQGQVTPVEFYTPCNISATANARDLKFCTRVGHVKSVLWWVSVLYVGVVRVTRAIFYIVDLENFAIASRRYTGDIHKTSVVGLFMTPIR